VCAKKQNDDMPKYLYKRSDGRSPNWHVRLTPPSEIHHLLPSSELSIRKSTGTPDRKKAQAVAARIEAKYRQEWEALRARIHDLTDKIALPTVGLTDSLITQICGARLASWSLTDNGERIENEGLDDEELQDIEQFCELSDAAMRSILAKGKRSSDWDDVVENILEWCKNLGYLVETTDPLFPRLVRSFADAEKTAQAIIRQRNAGDAAVFPTPELAKPRLSEMVEAYTAHKEGNVGRKTFTTCLSIWQRFIDFCGDIALDAVTSELVYRFLDDRLHTAQQPWSANYALGRAKNTLKEFFALARTRSMMTSANPVLALEITPKLSVVQAAERARPRHPYSAEQLDTLFASDWYVPTSSRFTGKMRRDLAARYWAPLICLFHGLRVREVVQLHSHDISVVEGVLLMTIQLDLTGTESSDAVERTVKNESTKRTVPVHPILIELGFADFVDTVRQRHTVGAPLFPSAVPDPNSKAPLWGRAYEQAFLRHVRERLAFGPGFGNHSFRHTIEDKIRDAQLLEGVWPAGLSQFYTGRKLPRDSDKTLLRLQGSEIDYGKGYNPMHMVGHIRRIEYKDVTLPPAFATWLAGATAVDPTLLRQNQSRHRKTSKTAPQSSLRSA
jgi:integrase